VLVRVVSAFHTAMVSSYQHLDMLISNAPSGRPPLPAILLLTLQLIAGSLLTSHV
jgi:hypothetical protein